MNNFWLLNFIIFLLICYLVAFCEKIVNCCKLHVFYNSEHHERVVFVKGPLHAFVRQILLSGALQARLNTNIIFLFI